MNEGARQANELIRHQQLTARLDSIAGLLSEILSELRGVGAVSTPNPYVTTSTPIPEAGHWPETCPACGRGMSS